MAPPPGQAPYSSWRRTQNCGSPSAGSSRPLGTRSRAAARHVGVLESAGLVEREVRGRDHWLSVRSAGLRPAEEWIAEQVSFWSLRADALAARLERRNRQR